MLNLALESLLCKKNVTEPLSPKGGESEMMNKYEVVYIMSPDIGEETTKSLVEKFKNLVETSAEMEGIDEWGKKRLAYPINFKNDGYYVMMNFKALPTFPSELERQFKITEGILRYLVLKKD